MHQDAKRQEMGITFYRALFDSHSQKVKTLSSKRSLKKITASKPDGNFSE